MHSRLEVELLPLDIELERTLKNLKKVRIAEVIAMTEQEGTDQHAQAKTITERPQRQRTMEDLWRPIIINEYSAVK